MESSISTPMNSRMRSRQDSRKKSNSTSATDGDRHVKMEKCNASAANVSNQHKGLHPPPVEDEMNRRGIIEWKPFDCTKKNEAFKFRKSANNKIQENRANLKEPIQHSWITILSETMDDTNEVGKKRVLEKDGKDMDESTEVKKPKPSESYIYCEEEDGWRYFESDAVNSKGESAVDLDIPLSPTFLPTVY